jgi:hypothetical protein
MKPYLYLFATACLLVQSACAPAPQPVQNSPIPTLAAARQSPLATPGPAFVATPATGKGVVTGVLMLGTAQNAKPVANVILYLAATIKDSGGNENVAEMDRVNSPRAATDGQGRFAFANVPPGKYGLVLDVITASYILNRPDDGKSFLFTVAAGETVNLGTLEYDSLPLPGSK